MIKTIQDYLELIRLNKPIGSMLLLWPTLTAIVLAYQGEPPAMIVLIFIVGVFLVRSAGCVVNDIADRHLDRHVKRTQFRPITSGRISVKRALVVCIVLLLVAFVLVCFLNKLTILMACVALAMAAVYPFFKRFTHLPQVWLGITFNWGILMAFTSTGGAVPLSGYLLYVAAVLITVAFDTMYGMADKADDLKIGIKSTAILFGEKDRLIIGVLQVIAWVLLLVVGGLAHLNGWFYLGLGGAALLMTYQQILIAKREPARCLQAFLNNNYSWALIFIGVVLSFL